MQLTISLWNTLPQDIALGQEFRKMQKETEC